MAENRTIKSLFSDDTQIKSFLEDLSIISVVLDNKSLKLSIKMEDRHWVTQKDKASIASALE